jgi:hypothetical protein
MAYDPTTARHLRRFTLSSMKTRLQKPLSGIIRRSLRSVFCVLGIALAGAVAAADLQPDSYGKTCGAATALGALSNGQSKTLQGTLQEATVQDWFLVSFPIGTMLKLTVQNSPATTSGSDFRLDAHATCGGPVIATGIASGDIKTLTLTNAAPHTVYLCVRAAKWTSAHATYKLVIVGEPAIVIRRK